MDSGSRFAAFPICSKVRTATGAFWLQVVVQVRGGHGCTLWLQVCGGHGGARGSFSGSRSGAVSPSQVEVSAAVAVRRRCCDDVRKWCSSRCCTLSVVVGGALQLRIRWSRVCNGDWMRDVAVMCRCETERQQMREEEDTICVEMMRKLWWLTQIYFRMGATPARSMADGGLATETW